jgi:hypothetical protein
VSTNGGAVARLLTFGPALREIAPLALRPTGGDRFFFGAMTLFVRHRPSFGVLRETSGNPANHTVFGQVGEKIRAIGVRPDARWGHSNGPVHRGELDLVAFRNTKAAPDFDWNRDLTFSRHGRDVA